MDSALTPTDFSYVSKLVQRQSGLTLGVDQLYLVNSRLTPLVQKYKFSSLPVLIEAVRRDKAPALEKAICEALATHESLFFRDPNIFTYLQTKAIPALLQAHKNQRPLRIWSAACSTGQEPYSILMALDKVRDPHGAALRFDLIASDFSSHAVQRAQAGIYSDFEVQRGLTAEQRSTYLEKHPEGWQIRAKQRERVSFREINLLHGFTRLDPIDVLFCRNVLIYFDEPTKRDIVARMTQVMDKHAYLFMGTSETTLHLSKAFAAVSPDRVNILQKVAAAAAGSA